MAHTVEAVRFADLNGFFDDDSLAAFQAFRRSAAALAEGLARTRLAVAPSRGLVALAREALRAEIADGEAARRFFVQGFRPWRVDAGGACRGFLTGYYEPRLRGSLTVPPEFSAPVLARPDDLVTFAAGEAPPSFEPGVSGAQRLPGGALRPYPERAAIEAAAAAGDRRAILWLRDSVELFMAQVQGSARVDLP